MLYVAVQQPGWQQRPAAIEPSRHTDGRRGCMLGRSRQEVVRRLLADKLARSG
jgi:hypothetical protein